MDLHPSEFAFLEQLVSAKASWLEAARSASHDSQAPPSWSDVPQAWDKLISLLETHESRAAFAAVVDELLAGVLHSALVVLDGGSALAEQTTLSIADADGHRFRTFLHEYWPGALARGTES